MQAAAAVKNLDNHALDKSHVFRVNHYEDFAVADKYADEYAPPEDTPFDENVRAPLCSSLLPINAVRRRRTFIRGYSTRRAETSLSFATAMIQRCSGTVSATRRPRVTANAPYASPIHCIAFYIRYS